MHRDTRHQLKCAELAIKRGNMRLAYHYSQSAARTAERLEPRGVANMVYAAADAVELATFGNVGGFH